MSANASPANLIPKTLHRRPGTLGRIINTIRPPLTHEPDRKMRLFRAIFVNNVDEALRLIKETGMTPNDINTIIKRNTFLSMASIKGMIDVVRALIEAGADVNKEDGYKNSVIQYASNKGHIDVVRALIDAGADVNKEDIYKRTALHLATDKGNINIIRALIEAGADVNKQDIHKETAINYVSALGHIDVVRALIEAGADVNIFDEYKRTALMFASGQGHIDIINALIEAGADVNMADIENNRAVDYARSNNRPDVVSMLLQSSAPIKSKLNIPITERAFNLNHSTDPVSLEEIKEGEEYYMMNSNVNPYTRNTMQGILVSGKNISPTTRKKIVEIRRHRRPNASGGRRTRKSKSKSQRQ